MFEKLDEGKAESTINNTMCAAVADRYRYEGTRPTEDKLVSAAKKIVAQCSAPPKRRKKADLTFLNELNRYLFTRLASTTDTQFLARLRDYCMFLLTYMAMTRPEATVRLLAADFSTIEVPTSEGTEVTLQIYSRDGKTNKGAPPHAILITAKEGGDSALNLLTWVKMYTDTEAAGRLATGRPRPTAMFYNLTKAAFGQELAAPTVTSRLKKHAADAGIPAQGITAYSFRVLGVSEALRKQVSIHLIKRHGNWKSDAVYSYVCDTDEERLATSRALRGIV
jgi:hypothetical protein